MTIQAPAPQTFKTAASITLLLGLAACGGGGDSADTAPPESARESAQTAVVTRTAGVIINEVMVANQKGATDSDGDRKDWVELFNTTAAAVNLSGFGLSNKTNSPFRWVFPTGTTIAARGYLRVWMSQKDRSASTTALHTNFNVDNGADDVVLTAPDGTSTGVRQDFTTPGLTRQDVSWCRSVNGSASAAFRHCLTPTPGAANSGTMLEGIVVGPTLSLPPGVYATAQTVTITGPAGATVRYTTDGSEPTETSTAVTGPITVSTSLSLRAAAFVTGRLPSLVASATYVIDAQGTYAGQRRMFLTMLPSEVSSYKAGGTTSSGWRGHASMVEPDGTVAFSGAALIEDAGQIGSRNGQQTLPLEIKFTDVVGNKSVSYPIFGVKPQLVTHRRLRLRNAGSDYWDAHLRDQYWQSILDNGQAPYAAYEPVQVFLNGQYHGVMDLREKEDENLVETTYKVERDLVQYLSDAEVKSGEGTKASYDEMSGFIRGNSMAVPANYERARTLLDVENFAHDFALHMFAVSPDWLFRNVHTFRMPDYDGRWRYRPHDFDITADLPPRFYATPVTRNMNSYYGQSTGGQIMNALLANPEFRTLYLNVIADQLNTIATAPRLNARLDTMAAQIQPYLAAHYARNPAGGSIANWTTQIQRLRNFLNAREPIYLGHTVEKFGALTRRSLQVGVNDPTMGTVKVNTIDLGGTLTAATPQWTGRYFAEVPVTLKAMPRPGHVFVGWEGAASGTAATITRNITADGTSFRAVFAPDAAVPAPSVTAIAAQALETGRWFSLQVQATDARDHKLSYAAKSLPSGLNLHPVTGLITGKPTRPGIYASTITVTNGAASTALPVSWTVAIQGNRVAALTNVIGGDGSGLVGEYFGNMDFTGTPALTRTEAPAVNVSAGALVAPGLPSSGWAIRWNGVLNAPTAGNYTLRTSSRTDDGVRVWVDGALVIDNWATPSTATRQAVVTLGANVPAAIRIEFRDVSSSASLALDWQAPGETVFQPMALGVFNPQ